MTTETAPATAEKMLTTRDLRRMYWRSTFLLGSFNFERMQAMGFCYTLMPAIRKFYRDDKSAQAAALKRHLEFYNTHPWVSSVVFGVTAAMEEQKAKGEEISEETITSVKVGLMGPLAGVGDPIFWGTARPVLAALGASLALNGSIVVIAPCVASVPRAAVGSSRRSPRWLPSWVCSSWAPWSPSGPPSSSRPWSPRSPTPTPRSSR